jgi:hypothetical protein
VRNLWQHSIDAALLLSIELRSPLQTFFRNAVYNSPLFSGTEFQGEPDGDRKLLFSRHSDSRIRCGAIPYLPERANKDHARATKRMCAHGTCGKRRQARIAPKMKDANASRSGARAWTSISLLFKRVLKPRQPVPITHSKGA